MTETKWRGISSNLANYNAPAPYVGQVVRVEDSILTPTSYKKLVGKVGHVVEIVESGVRHGYDPHARGWRVRIEYGDGTERIIGTWFLEQKKVVK